jgi:hypothetical protein
VVIAGSVGLALGLRSSPANTHRNRPASAAAIRSQAATWVAQQISQNTLVSCDHTMCTALAQHHFPARNLHVLDSTSANPAGSSVIVATPAVRHQFGSSLSSSLAPLVLAKFGTGRGQIDVRVIAPHGASALRQQLAQDILTRKQSGVVMLGSKRIVVSAVAHRQLAAGLVDTRLLVDIVFMAAQHPLKILAFSDSGPHASPGVPLRMAQLAETAGVDQATWMQSMLEFLQVQQDPYLPMHEGNTLRAGQNVLFVEFGAPSPLGLIGTKTR